MGKNTNELRFDEIFERVVQHTDIQSSKDLAQFLNISASSVSKQKTCNAFPANWLISIAEKCDVDLNYLVFGDEPAPGTKDPDEEFTAVLVRYLKSKYPLANADHHSGEIKIIKGEIDNLIARLAQHLLR